MWYEWALLTSDEIRNHSCQSNILYKKLECIVSKEKKLCLRRRLLTSAGDTIIYVSIYQVALLAQFRFEAL